MTQKRIPYIKPTRLIHSSGFGIFEIGYIEEMSKNNTVLKKTILGTCTDHVFQDYMSGRDKKFFHINIDLTKDGYIRFFDHNNQLMWDSICGLSSMGLTIYEKPI